MASGHDRRLHFSYVGIKLLVFCSETKLFKNLQLLAPSNAAIYQMLGEKKKSKKP